MLLSICYSATFIYVLSVISSSFDMWTLNSHESFFSNIYGGDSQILFALFRKAININ